MNTPDRRDGRLDIWIRLPEAAETEGVSRSDMRWRSTADFAVDALLFQTFHGGGDRSWAPRKPCSTLYEQIVVLRP